MEPAIWRASSEEEEEVVIGYLQERRTMQQPASQNTRSSVPSEA